jgi:tRNA pseudouridine55 synthase
LTGGAAATVERRTRGILALDKPAGITSFEAVREVRRLFSERRVGHAGTLDPTATGLLPVCVGRATRLVDYFHAQPKTYHCVVRLGERSDTYDTEGTVVAGGDATGIDEETVRRTLQRFVGEISQVPPMHSAVRHEGRHLYELAREGKEVERRPRPVSIHSAELVGFKPGRVAQAEVVVSCGKGAYMRVLAADLGEAVGSGGLLGWLSRTSYGSLDLHDAVTLPALAAMPDPRDALLPLDVAVTHLPKIDVAPALEQLLRRGQPVWLPRTQVPAGAGECRAHAVSGELIAIGELSGLLFRPTKVLVG